MPYLKHVGSNLVFRFGMLRTDPFKTPKSFTSIFQVLIAQIFTPRKKICLQMPHIWVLLGEKKKILSRAVMSVESNQVIMSQRSVKYLF